MDFTKCSVEELMDTARKYKAKKDKHAQNMRKYREAHLDEFRARAAVMAKRLYWRKKGYTIDALGEKIPIAVVLG